MYHEINNETSRDNMKYSLASAAIAVGKSKATIHRAVVSGKISAFRNYNGIYEIDASELYRVFEPVSLKQNDTLNETKDVIRDALLKQENEFLRHQLQKETELVNNLTHRLNSLEERINSLLLLLTHQPPTSTTSFSYTPHTKTSLWKKIFKR